VTMGIKGLNTFLKKHTNAVKTVSSSIIRGTTVALDGNLALYQFVCAIKYKCDYPHLTGLFYRVIGYLENNIDPIFVFDGKAPDIKGPELLRRNERR